MKTLLKRKVLRFQVEPDVSMLTVIGGLIPPKGWAFQSATRNSKGQVRVVYVRASRPQRERGRR
jgi:hypothetical protein